MKKFYKINLLFSIVLLTLNCFSLNNPQDFQTQLKKFLTNPNVYSGIMEQKDIDNVKTILNLISKKSPEFLTYNFYDKTCLSEVEKIISTNSGDPKLIDSIKYWTELQEFIKSKIKGN